MKSLSRNLSRPPLPLQPPRRRWTPVLLLSLLSFLSLTWGAGPALAQTAHRSATRQNADHRRAQREAKRLQTPYEETHLLPGQHLRRGAGDHPRPEGSDQFRYENGNRPRVVQPVFLALRRKRKVQQ